MSQRFGWGHLNINVADLDASIDFYRKLGFQPFVDGIPYLNLQSGHAAVIPPGPAAALGLAAETRARAMIMQLDEGFPKIDLTELSETDPRPPLANSDRGLVRLCLISQNLETDHRELSDQGIEFVTPPTRCHDRLADVAVCRDPDGTLIELLQVYLERWEPYLS